MLLDNAKGVNLHNENGSIMEAESTTTQSARENRLRKFLSMLSFVVNQVWLRKSKLSFVVAKLRGECKHINTQQELDALRAPCRTIQVAKCSLSVARNLEK